MGNKPVGCVVRKCPPEGPLVLCRDACTTYDLCVDYTEGRAPHLDLEVSHIDRLQEYLAAKSRDMEVVGEVVA